MCCLKDSEKKYRKERWETLFKEQRESGLPIRYWCSLKGINYGTFRTLRYRYGAKTSRAERRSDAEWLELIAHFENSGMSLRTWCKKHGILYGTLINEKTRVKGRD